MKSRVGAGIEQGDQLVPLVQRNRFHPAEQKLCAVRAQDAGAYQLANAGIDPDQADSDDQAKDDQVGQVDAATAAGGAL